MERSVRRGRKKPAIEEVKDLLVQLNDTLNWIPSGLREQLSDIERRITDVEARIHTVKSAGFEKLEDLDNRVRLMEMNIRVIRRTLYVNK
jgi:uncharacterized protein YjdB